MNIIPYSNEKQQVVNLLIELQEYLVSVDDEKVQTIDDEYGEKYFTYLQGLVKNHDGIILLAVSGSEVVGFIAGYIEPKDEEDIITNRCPKRGIISDLAVTASCRGSGVGKDLMNARGMNRGIMGSYESYIRLSYKDWLRTQTETFPLPKEYHYSWLTNISQMFSRRAPGNTCVSALMCGEVGSTENPINHSKGCGGVMRVAPIGLYFCDKHCSIDNSDAIGAETAAVTHGHTLGWLPAVALVHIIRRLAENEETILDAVLDSMEDIKRRYANTENADILLSFMQKAIDLSYSELDDLDAIHLLGQGWAAEETLAIAIYCSLKYPKNIERALIAAVNHGGDSDSTGAVTGNILGASLGAEEIPQKFVENLELRDIILEVADDLYNDCKMTEYGDYYDPVWVAKYIEMTYPKVREKKQ